MIPVDEVSLRARALQGLKAGLGYALSPIIRAQAIEALGETVPIEGQLYFQEALRDPAPVVRFAACMAMCTLEDAKATDLLRLRLQDEDRSVQVAAIYALHRMGSQQHTSLLADRLLRDPDVQVRRNAAMILGMLGEPGSIRLLRHAARDQDESVSLQAYESMAILGDAKAMHQLAVQAHDGAGHRQTLALAAMGRINDPRFLEVLRFRLKEGPYNESRLAAARSLGLMGYDDGLEVALGLLRFNNPRRDQPDDPPETQIMRVRSMAALALGAIGDRRALGPLQRALDDQGDARVQIAAAKAILQIVDQTPYSVRGTDNGTRVAGHDH